MTPHLLFGPHTQTHLRILDPPSMAMGAVGRVCPPSQGPHRTNPQSCTPPPPPSPSSPTPRGGGDWSAARRAAADTMTYLQKEYAGVDQLVTLATLTGAIIIALGHYPAGTGAPLTQTTTSPRPTDLPAIPLVTTPVPPPWRPPPPPIRAPLHRNILRSFFLSVVGPVLWSGCSIFLGAFGFPQSQGHPTQKEGRASSVAGAGPPTPEGGG